MVDFTNLWVKYLSYIRSQLSSFEANPKKDMSYWRNELFIKMVGISIPVSISVMIPSITLTWSRDSLWIPITDLSAFLGIVVFTLCTRYVAKVKMSFAIGILTCLAVFFVASLGSLSIGSIYLLSLSVIISLLFSKRTAYCSIGLNVVILSTFSFLIDGKFIDWRVMHHYSFNLWITFCINFLFLNLLVVIQITNILDGMQKTINHEEKLLLALQLEVELKTERNLRLADSEGHYKSLFFNNPSPMWVFDPITFRFLQVNQATVTKYGFSTEEFIEMTIDQIRVEPLDLILEALRYSMATDTFFSNVALHKKKNGNQFYAKVRSSTIPFQGKQALLVIAHDITTQIEHSNAIEKQNDQLKAIAYMQSHTIRAPLAKIKGLWSLVALDPDGPPDLQLYQHMQHSIEELDRVILGIIKDSKVIMAEKNEDTSEQ